MCFSATASFGLAATLVPAGLACIAYARKLEPGWTGFAIYPLAFAVQQSFEGLVWLGLGDQDPTLVNAGALGFLFFSHFFWVVWVPFSVYLLHRNDAGRRAGLVLMNVLGGALALALFGPLLAHDGPVPVTVSAGSINYGAPLIIESEAVRRALKMAYLAIIAGSLVLSPNRAIQGFGGFIALSLVATELWFSEAFISVWCYFAAVLSLYILAVMARETRKGAGVARPARRH